MMISKPKSTVEKLCYPNNRLADIAQALARVKNGESVKVEIDSLRRAETIRTRIKQVFTSTTFNDNVEKTAREKYVMQIYPVGQTNPENYPARTLSITAVRMGASGKYVDPFNMSVHDVTIEDIAHHLARICCFNGGSTGHYSVADHCVAVSNSLPEPFKMWGLLHDAAKAYLGDITRPVRVKYNAIIQEDEDRILQIVADKFGLVPTVPNQVLDADNRQLRRELEQLEQGRLTGNPHYTAEKMFLALFKHLTK